MLYLSKSRRQQNARTYIEAYSDVRYKLPHKVGKYYYSYIYNNDRSSASLCMREHPNDAPWVIADPYKISKTEVINIGGFAPSKKADRVAFMFNRNGSDWQEIMVSKKSGSFLNDHLTGVKFSTIKWKDDGFFYHKYLQREQFSGDTMPQIYYHKLGTAQSADALIDKYDTEFGSHTSFDVTSDERYLLIYKKHEASGGFSVFYIDLNEATWQLKPLVSKIDC